MWFFRIVNLLARWLKVIGTILGHMLKVNFISKLLSDLILKRKLKFSICLTFMSFKDKHSSFLNVETFKENVSELNKLNTFSTLKIPVVLLMVVLQVLFGMMSVGVTIDLRLLFPRLSIKSKKNIMKHFF